MAKESRRRNNKKAKRPSLKYFYLNDQLHVKLSINRGKDLLTAWNYPEGKKVLYTYSDVLRRHERAVRTSEVCDMINRKRLTIEIAMRDGHIERPQHTYSLDEHRNMHMYMWREKDIMDLLAYLSTVHRGRPRKDGVVTPQHLPTPRELRAMIRNEGIMYVKQGDEFIPSWRAEQF